MRILRLLLNIPQATLAKRADISVRELARIENGSVTPARETFMRLDNAFLDIVRERLRTA